MLVHLVDGTYELFRSHFGAPSSVHEGVEVGATRGLLRSLALLLRTPGVTHVGVAFDHVIESFRNDLFEGYKTGDGIEPDLLRQFPIAEAASRALGIVTWPMVEFEADDALATAAARFREDPRVDQVVIASPDKDLAQCVVANRVVRWDRRRDEVLDEAGVLEKYGVPPASIPSWLGLVGDSADGIPGIPRWGAKSSAIVLRSFSNVASIPERAEDWDVPVRGGATLAQNLSEQRAEALLYERLATLRTDVPLEETLDDLEWKGASRGELAALCNKLGDDVSALRIERWRSRD